MLAALLLGGVVAPDLSQERRTAEGRRRSREDVAEPVKE